MPIQLEGSRKTSGLSSQKHLRDLRTKITAQRWPPSYSTKHIGGLVACVQGHSENSQKRAQRCLPGPRRRSESLQSSTTRSRAGCQGGPGPGEGGGPGEALHDRGAVSSSFGETAFLFTSVALTQKSPHHRAPSKISYRILNTLITTLFIFQVWHSHAS